MNILKVTAHSLLAGFSIVALSATLGYARQPNLVSITAGAHGAGQFDAPQQSLNPAFRAQANQAASQLKTQSAHGVPLPVQGQQVNPTYQSNTITHATASSRSINDDIFILNPLTH